MSGQREQLQALIADIDGVLGRATPNLPWVMSGGTAEQRQLLERVRGYLASLNLDSGGMENRWLDNRPDWSGDSSIGHVTGAVQSQQVSQQILQAVMHELSYLRAGLIQPIQADIERLQQQRAALQAEISQLELRRQYYLQGQESSVLPLEALHTLIAQLQAVLAQSGLSSGQVLSGGVSSPELLGQGYAPQQVQQLQALQAQSDRLLMSLDTTLRIVCESLQHNLKTYEESLSQGLQKMHSLGQQGEMMFTAWMNFLVQRLGQETAAYLQGSYLAANPSSANTATPDSQSSSTLGTTTRLTPQIQRVLDQLGITPPVVDIPYPDDVEMPLTSSIPSAVGGHFSLEDMDLDDLDISDLNLDSPQPVVVQDDDHRTLRQQTQEATSEEMVGLKPVQADDDLNSALEFLEQLSAALNDQPTDTSEQLLLNSDDVLDDTLDDVEGAIELSDLSESILSDSMDRLDLSDADDLLSVLDDLPAIPELPSDTTTTTLSEMPSLQKPDNLEPDSYELDAFYQSLFGNNDAALAASKDVEPGTVVEGDAQIDFEGLSQRMDVVVDMVMEAPSSLQPADEDMATNAVIEPDVIDASVSLQSDGMMTLESSDLFPNVEMFLESSDLLLLNSDADDADDIDANLGNIQHDSDHDISASEDDVIPASPLPLTLDDLFRSEEPEPLVHQSLQVNSLSLGDVLPGSPDAITTPVASDNELGDHDALAGLDDFLGLSQAIPSTENANFTAIAPSVSVSPSTSSQPSQDIGAGGTDEDYIPASPDEMLLVSDFDSIDEATPVQDVDFWLNASVLRQLSDDLSNLEYSRTTDDAWEMLPFDDSTDTFDDRQADSALADLHEDLVADLASDSFTPQTQPATASFPLYPPGTVNPERLDTLFAALGDSAEPQPPNLESPDLENLTPEGLEAIFAGLPVDENDSTTEEIPLTLDSLPENLGDAVASPSVSPLTNPLAAVTLSPSSLATADSALEDVTIDDMFAEFSGDAIDQKKKIDNDLGVNAAAMPTVLQANTHLQTNTVLQADRASHPPQYQSIQEEPSADRWYLGLDIGTTGISAVLLNCTVGKVYPLGWQVTESSEVMQSSRLPAIAYLSASDGSLQAVGNQVEAMQALLQSAQGGDRPSIVLHHFKPYLKVALPFQPAGELPEPQIRWSTQAQVSIRDIQRTLQTLLAQLLTPNVSQVSALGLDTIALRRALASLSGVVLGYPHNWSDTYSINLRDVVLRAGLVQAPDQVIFLDETIAAVLSGLSAVQGALRPVGRRQRLPKGMTWRGSTLVISSGATLTELAVVFLPDQIHELSYHDFSFSNLAYAGNAIDQDILGYVLYPAWVEQQNLTIAQAQVREQVVAGDLFPDFTIPNPDVDWEALGIVPTELPTPGEPDVSRRQALQQRLEGSAFGILLLEAARYIKLALQYRQSVAIAIGNHTCIIQRRRLESEVFLPFVKRLNETMKALLEHTGFLPQTINQVICTGGTASLPAIARWLRRRLPNATIIQDTYAPDQVLPQLLPNGVTHILPMAPLCSRVAYGLAVLPLYPNVLDISRHQYSDYFLLAELLRLVTDREQETAATPPTFSLQEVTQCLSHKGIETHTCQHRILALLEGHLPPGLVPSAGDRALFSPESLSHSLYQHLIAVPLFTGYSDPVRGQVYRANLEQCRRVQDFLELVFSDSCYPLNRPLTVALSPISTPK